MLHITDTATPVAPLDLAPPDARISPLDRRPRRGECRFCGEPLRRTFVDLGTSPLCQRHVEPHRLRDMEPHFPLHVRVCDRCQLVQLEESVHPTEIFADYAYFSSYSDTWLQHARLYAREMVSRLDLGPQSLVVEVGSNDGYLLRHFFGMGISVLGVEPAENVARAAIARGIPTTVRFFGRLAARRIVASYGHADLITANNVLPHVPDINDFVAGLRMLLKPRGVVTLEFPHLMRLMERNQFDTIYQEHYSYLSFAVAERILAAHGLRVFDVEELSTHGGSLRLFARHVGDNRAASVSPRVHELRETEAAGGLPTPERCAAFTGRVRAVKRRLLGLLIDAKDDGRSIAAYGAPGKGSTLLNYCGIRTDLIDYTVDRNPRKQGNYLPGSRIPIHHPDRIRETRPDYLLILPWNLRDEIIAQTAFIRDWGGRFIVPIPDPSVIE